VLSKVGATAPAGKLCGGDASAKFQRGTELVLSRKGEYRLLNNNVLGTSFPDDAPLEQRGPMLAMMYKEYDPDILMLQELSSNARLALESDVKALGYKEISAPLRSDSAACTVFYRASQFTELTSGRELLDDGMNNRNTQIAWAVLEDKTNGNRIGVISTHFYWVSRNEEAAAEDYRLLDAKHVERIAEMLKDEWNVPVICSGDFNSTSVEKAFQYLGGLYDNVQKTCPVTENSTTWHTAAAIDAEWGIYLRPRYPEGNSDTAIDRIYAVAGVTPKVFDVVTDLYAVLGSDHCPLLMDFDLTDPS
jgi:endonuclease/exonuclease/phosphatase family metal-dependent hydrolase